MTTPQGIPLPFIAKVAGVSFHQDAVRQLQEGDPLEVVHDPENPYDANAYAVRRLDTTLIGHLPRELAARLHARAEGPRYEASVREVLRGETWGLRVRIGTDEHAVLAREYQESREEESGIYWGDLPDAQPIAPASAGDPEALRAHQRTAGADAIADALHEAAAMDTLRRSDTPDDLSSLLDTPDTTPAREASSAAAGALVRARSGRVLGTYLRSEGGKVVAASPNGAEVAYPERIVVIEPGS